ncbi:hypothetical protein COTS27_01382 [Spirochaetota bacterium]|nr:hypothetical protein COTS27_01382 [Spirochaetota bacterium]
MLKIAYTDMISSMISSMISGMTSSMISGVILVRKLRSWLEKHEISIIIFCTISGLAINYE